MKYSEEQIKALIKGIEDGIITEWNLPVSYYNALTDYLSKAVFDGFGSTLETAIVGDLPLLEQLVTNVHLFGAAKTFQQVKEINSLLVDSDGKVRTSREFNKIARETYDNWNDNWGRTEYNTAIAQSDMGAKWIEIEKQKDVMPFLKYSAIGDACTICRPLDNIIAPVDSPIWSKIMPINHFSCYCSVLQVRSGETEGYGSIVDHVEQTMKDKGQDMFINNAGQTGMVFTKEHPYFTVEKEYKAYAKRNFDLPLPKFE